MGKAILTFLFQVKHKTCELNCATFSVWRELRNMHTSLCPVMVRGQTSDVCLLSWGVCGCLPAGTWLSSQPWAPGCCRNCRGEKHLGISLPLLICHLSLTLPLATSNSSGPVKKLFISLCHLTKVSSDLSPFPFLSLFPFLFPFFVFLPCLLAFSCHIYIK